MSKRGLGWQLGVAFAAVAVATAVIAGGMLSAVWQRQFDAYVRQRLQDNADGYALSAARVYLARGGWPSSVQVRFDSDPEALGLRVQVFDGGGTIVADSAVNRPEDLIVGADAPPPDALAASSDVIVNDTRVGYVKVWSVSRTGLLTERDVAFRAASTGTLVFAALLAAALATAAGVLYSRGLVRPINRVTATAASLRAGKRDARTGMHGDDPLGMLGRTLDEMADSIEADRQFERRLTADVAHELRTPLMAIQATVEAMQDGVLPADEERLQTVRDETVRLARLADTILELARLERGAVPMAREELDPAAPLRMALSTHRALIESAGLTLSESVWEGMRVCGDADRLTQAFGNLLSNAARYTPAEGSVSVGLAREGDEAVVTIADTGIGIAEEELPNVFVRFWRADAARSRATGGLGVGLAVVKEIVDRHDGRIAVDSRAGEGTTFTVRLPLMPEPAEEPRRLPFRRGRGEASGATS